MSDEELTELAAKAVRLPECGWMGPAFMYVKDNRLTDWNPLADDGDALRLVSDLRLKVLPGKHQGDGCTVETQRAGIAGCTTFRDDKREQMRRAIVLAAAEIGKAMP